MSNVDVPELERALAQLMEIGLPEHPAADVTAALQVADLLEAKGYAFLLQDMCPRSLGDSMWRAVFSRDGAEFSADHAEAAVAVCAAAVAALKGLCGD